ncbi:polyprenyl synthetase family protein [Legionella nagasakiensis]|uniref:polyprenyl synthetase family protein n=1 Tax=Legionella nagasakiensis TaxID=535290 RepID=UPI0010546351|nr:polyprenyl synthetase family protein [Legionella nagasakiensis]
MNNQTMSDCLIRHEAMLQTLLNQLDIPAPRIKEAIIYTLFPGGKRLRPMLVYLCGKLIKVPLDSLDIIAAAIELTHCYSLVHDDLPAMDNDNFRRGKPSCHRAFDEATAILVGDGMQVLAIDVLLNFLPKTLSLQQVITVTQELVKASGPSGMVSGQSLDLSELAKPSINESQLCEIHRLKTGKLISACINMVLAAGNPTPDAACALRQFATHLGLVFQMQDDYLDRYGNAKLGKGRASDIANQKTTFATLYDKQELFFKIQNLYLQARQELTFFSEKAHDLLDLLQSLQQQLEK